jgi:DNA-directed RNA polymerase sigma subunit (sigma70/sigma32)
MECGTGTPPAALFALIELKKFAEISKLVKFLQTLELHMLKTKFDFYKRLNGKEAPSAQDADQFALKVLPYFAKLNPILPEVILMRYGLKHKKGMSYNKIGADYGVTGDRIRQVLMKGFLHYKYDKYKPL